MKRTITALLLVALLADAALACFVGIPPEEVQKGNRLADRLFQVRDVDGLTELLTKTNYITQQRAALLLGRLGAKSALPSLIQLDKAYKRNTTISLGAFSTAIAMIEGDSDEARRQALLTLARTGFRSVDDLESWREEATEQVQGLRRTKEETESDLAWIAKQFGEARQCILEHRVYEGADRNRRDAAAEALLDLADGPVIRELRPIYGYGAQYTVLAYRCRQLSQDVSIALCVALLGRHKTPLEAESAERILKSLGKPALPAVRKLLEEQEALVTAPSPPFSIHHTVVSRCKQIIREVEANKASDSDKE